ncbi:nicotinate-nucleotide adenylyltransferase [Bacillus sp. RG28]|uniref:Probable nicotinate-nucleotide adenylyltransferase n=2 Tax=Gottfriedia endophytica TaxID=2820819 RepID=A0A940SIF6_9BACI|nr:nicotinate-nucleotide adenylyltransferase [Gottfriedia endophytica]
MKMKRRIGIIGGTFDPPHNGHLLMANEVYHTFSLDEVWFMPNNIPPHKQNNPFQSSIHRKNMVKLAIEGLDYFKLCEYEIEHNGPSYTYKTMLDLTTKFPDVDFYFIIGGDMVEYLPKWREIDELVKLVKFIGCTRPGYTLETPYDIEKLTIPEFAVSSTLIRERLKSGGTTRFLLPDSVRRYLEENHLYE